MHSPRNITPSFTYTTSEEIVNSFRPVSGAIQTRLLASPRIGRHTDGGDQRRTSFSLIIDRQIVQNTINHTSSKRPKLTRLVRKVGSINEKYLEFQVLTSNAK